MESLTQLAEALAKIWFSDSVEFLGVEEAWRLHRGTLKRGATDLISGHIDIFIPTSDPSAAGRERCMEMAAAPRKIIKERARHRP